MTFKKTATDEENVALIRWGLNRVSHKNREYLKYVARTLVLVQKQPGHPIPSEISKQIMKEWGTEDVKKGN